VNVQKKFLSLITYIRSHSDQIAKIVAFVLAVSFIVLFVVLSLKRVLYPYEVEWMEGSFIRHAARIYAGQPLFVKPSIYFVNWLYQPLSYYCIAAIMHWTGITCTAGRVITFSSTMITAILVYFAVIRLTNKSHYTALIGAGLFLACYGLTDLCFDIVRPDPLFVTLLVASVVVLLYSQRLMFILVSALLITLAIFTKQQAIYYVLPVAIWLFLQKRSSAAIYVGVVILFFAIGTYIFYLANGDWYFYYVYLIPQGKSGSLNYSRMIFVFSSFVFSGWGVASISTLLSFFILAKEGKSFFRSTNGFLAIILLGCIFHMAIHLSDVISGRNSAMPFAAFLAIALPVALKDVRAFIPDTYKFILPWLIVFQFLGSLYTPKRLPFGVVTAADHKASDRFVDSLRAMNGNVMLWNNSLAAEFAGKRSYANDLAVADVLSVGDSISRQFGREWKQAFDDRIFDAIIIDDVTYNNLDSIPGYTFSRFINTGSDPFKNYYGAVPSYPRYVLVPR